MRRSRESCRAEDQVIIFCPTKQFCHNCALKVTDCRADADLRLCLGGATRASRWRAAL